MMSSLKSGSYINDPNSPVQMLIGAPPATVSGSQGIPAKVEFEKSKEAPEKPAEK